MESRPRGRKLALAGARRCLYTGADIIGSEICVIKQCGRSRAVGQVGVATQSHPVLAALFVRVAKPPGEEFNVNIFLAEDQLGRHKWVQLGYRIERRKKNISLLAPRHRLTLGH